MQTRRNIVGLISVWFLGKSVKAETSALKPVKELSRQALIGPQAGMDAILVEVTAAPGAPSMVHRHPGFVMGYVLDGEMKFAINGQDEKVVSAGDSFYEPFGALHTVGGSAKADKPVRFLAFIVAPSGSPVVMPA